MPLNGATKLTPFQPSEPTGPFSYTTVSAMLPSGSSSCIAAPELERYIERLRTPAISRMIPSSYTERVVASEAKMTELLGEIMSEPIVVLNGTEVVEICRKVHP